MADQYYRFFPGDYQRDTGDLTLVEHGAYRVLLDHYYTCGPLPNDPDRLNRICRAFSTGEQTAVATVVQRFFQPDGDRLRNRKADKEMGDRQVFIESQREKGRRSAELRAERAREEQDNSTGVEPGLVPVLQPESNLPSPSPSPSPKPKKDKRDMSPTGSLPPSYSQDFESFWTAYPKKAGKAATYRQWKKIKSRPPLPDILQAVRDRVAADKYAQEQGLFYPEWPDPERWIKNERWADDHGSLTGGKQYGTSSKGTGTGDDPEVAGVKQFLRTRKSTEGATTTGQAAPIPSSNYGRSHG